jgi:polar amino acid transport system substrate-binding protein
MNRRSFHALLLAALGSSCADRSKKLVIGTDATYPPFEFVDERGQIAGIDIEIGRFIAAELGKQAEFKNINFDGLITALQSGSVDMIISSMTANDERRESVAFSDPYVKTGIALLISTKSPVKTVDDLKAEGRRVVVRLGTTGESYAKEHLPDVKRVTLDSDPACVLEVVNGSVDAWIYDQISIMKNQARHPEATRTNLTPLREEVWAIALRKGENQLLADVNKALAKMRAGGEFSQLAEKHLKQEREMMRAQGLPFVFE